MRTINRAVYDFAKKGYISSEAISKNEPTSEMKSGKYAVVNGRRSAEKSTNLYGFECVETTPTYGAISTTSVLNSVNAISAKSKHIEESVKLLNLIWEDSYLSNLLAYGIEGKDFTVDKGDIHNYNKIISSFTSREFYNLVYTFHFSHTILMEKIIVIWKLLEFYGNAKFS